jgi:uncharacterized Fe-S cluster protein YjdI
MIEHSEEEQLAGQSEEQLLANGYRKYRGSALDVYYNKERCIHSGNCVRGNAAVFEVGRRPWVIPDNGSKEQVAQVIQSCPKGALRFIVRGES